MAAGFLDLCALCDEHHTAIPLVNAGNVRHNICTPIDVWNSLHLAFSPYVRHPTILKLQTLAWHDCEILTNPAESAAPQAMII